MGSSGSSMSVIGDCEDDRLSTSGGVDVEVTAGSTGETAGPEVLDG